MTSLFQSVIWPAAAGNVAWAFFSIFVTVGSEWREGTFWAKVLVLFFVALYLGVEWLHTELLKGYGEFTCGYWIADACLAVAIAVFAIATQGNFPWSSWVLAVNFTILFLGHCIGLWRPPDEFPIPYEPWQMAQEGLLGLLILIIGHICGLQTPSFFIWTPPVAVAWVIIRYALHCKGGKSVGGPRATAHVGVVPAFVLRSPPLGSVRVSGRSEPSPKEAGILGGGCTPVERQ